jgi:hypothetical protein
MSIGVHAAWNFTQGWIWGARVSGIPGAGEPLSEHAQGRRARVAQRRDVRPGGFGPGHGDRHRRGGGGALRAWKKGNFKARSESTPAVADVFD